MSRRRILAASVLATVALTASLQASTPLYWDTNDIAAGAGSPANGTWDTATANWNQDSTGGNANGPLVAYPADGSSTDVVFSAGTDATGTNNVVVNGSFAANSLTCEEGALRLAGVAGQNSSLSIGAGGINVIKGASTLGAPQTDANLTVIVAADQTWTQSTVASFTTFNGPVQFNHNLTLTRTTTTNNANFLFKSDAGTGSGTILVSGTSNAVTIQVGASGVYDASNNLVSGPLGTGTVQLSAGRLSSNSASSPNFNIGNPIVILSSAAIGGQSNTGPLTFTNSVTVDAAASGKTITLDAGTNAATNSQTLVFNGPFILQGNAAFTVATNNTTTINGNLSDDSASTSIAKTLSKSGAGILNLAGNITYTGATAVNNGTLNLASSFISPAAFTVGNTGIARLTTGGDKILRVDSLNLNTTGKLDLGDGTLIVNTTDPATLKGYISTGNDSGAWDGPGIDSNALSAANDPSHIHTIAFASGSDLFGASGGTYRGQAVSATASIIRATYNGDLNLDGIVNADDYSLIDRYVAANGLGTTTNAVWVNGDINGDGSVTSADYLLMDTAFGKITGQLSESLLDARAAEFGPAYVATLTAAVPEPASLALATLALLPALSRARRRSR